MSQIRLSLGRWPFLEFSIHLPVAPETSLADHLARGSLLHRPSAASPGDVPPGGPVGQPVRPVGQPAPLARSPARTTSDPRTPDESLVDPSNVHPPVARETPPAGPLARGSRRPSTTRPGDAPSVGSSGQPDLLDRSSPHPASDSLTLSESLVEVANIDPRSAHAMTSADLLALPSCGGSIQSGSLPRSQRLSPRPAFDPLTLKESLVDVAKIDPLFGRGEYSVDPLVLLASRLVPPKIGRKTRVNMNKKVTASVPPTAVTPDPASASDTRGDEMPDLVSASDSSKDDEGSLNRSSDPLLHALPPLAVLEADPLPEVDDSDTPSEPKELGEEAAAAAKRDRTNERRRELAAQKRAAASAPAKTKPRPRNPFKADPSHRYALIQVNQTV